LNESERIAKDGGKITRYTSGCAVSSRVLIQIFIKYYSFTLKYQLQQIKNIKEILTFEIDGSLSASVLNNLEQ
jgi:hypothetical protein